VLERYWRVVRADAICSVRGAVHARVWLCVGMRKMAIGVANGERSWRLEFLVVQRGSIRRHSLPGTWHWPLLLGFPGIFTVAR
jgi:hypothetical protein